MIKAEIIIKEQHFFCKLFSLFNLLRINVNSSSFFIIAYEIKVVKINF